MSCLRKEAPTKMIASLTKLTKCTWRTLPVGVLSLPLERNDKGTCVFFFLFLFFCFFLNLEDACQSFLSNKLILLHSRNTIWKKDSIKKYSKLKKLENCMYTVALKKRLWIMRWSILELSSVESWAVLDTLQVKIRQSLWKCTIY